MSEKKHLAFGLTELSTELSPISKRGMYKTLDFVRWELRKIILDLVLLKRYVHYFLCVWIRNEIHIYIYVSYNGYIYKQTKVGVAIWYKKT